MATEPKWKRGGVKLGVSIALSSLLGYTYLITPTDLAMMAEIILGVASFIALAIGPTLGTLILLTSLFYGSQDSEDTPDGRKSWIVSSGKVLLIIAAIPSMMFVSLLLIMNMRFPI